ncbi:hypothetical protein HPA02_11420 [Bisbaumannia pacifica]|uniref:DUF4062 domain-containing protein n=1 Tax=Bisbaumannia pacifica TaxID=77098 RepID=A0A510X628_9GAMM|nr:DUF4062 domain-containing protein [Halomonas pacifica]GEK46859.1 hypothetical protein HPA02_11420 [Halomonas pacifica]
MERKHQVFVSSTYRDLVEERKEVIHALLELDCIPAGMELFPATDEDAWSLITEVIDGCDYYVLILAGKYGSANKEGIGYTEMEFDYAVSRKKPILCFLHEDLEALPASKIEGSDKGKSRLESFREKAKEKHCKFWTTAPDLGGKVSRSMVQLKKKHPSDGWVPGRFAVDQKMVAEMERLRARVAELEMEALVSHSYMPENVEGLEGGNDKYPIPAKIITDGEGNSETIMLEVSWDKIFAYCGPALSGECTSKELNEKIELAYFHAIPQDVLDFNSRRNITIPYVCEDQIHVQLQALGLMEPGQKKRAVSDTNTYWKLTPFGEQYLIQIKALRKKSEKSMQSAAKPSAD